MKMKDTNITGLATILVILSAINAGLIGLFSINIMVSLFGQASLTYHVIYSIIGLAGLYLMYVWLERYCPQCNKEQTPEAGDYRVRSFLA